MEVRTRKGPQVYLLEPPSPPTLQAPPSGAFPRIRSQNAVSALPASSARPAATTSQRAPAHHQRHENFTCARGTSYPVHGGWILSPDSKLQQWN